MKIAKTKLFSLFLIFSLALGIINPVLANPSWSNYTVSGAKVQTGHTMGYDMMAKIGDLSCFVFIPATALTANYVLYVQVFDDDGNYIRELDYTIDGSGFGTGDEAPVTVRLFYYSDEAFGIQLLYVQNVGGTPSLNVLTLICDGVSDPSDLYAKASLGNPFGSGYSGHARQLYMTQIIKTESDHYICGVFLSDDTTNVQRYYYLDMTLQTLTAIDNQPAAGYWYGLPTIFETSDATIHLMAKGLESYYNSATKAVTDVWNSGTTYAIIQYDTNQPCESWLSQASWDATSGLFDTGGKYFVGSFWDFLMSWPWGDEIASLLDYGDTDDAYFQGFEGYTLSGGTSLYLTAYYWNSTTDSMVISSYTATSCKGIVDTGQLNSMYSWTLLTLGSDNKYYQLFVSLDSNFNILSVDKTALGSLESGLVGSLAVRYPAHFFQGVTQGNLDSDLVSPYCESVSQGHGDLYVWDCAYAVGQGTTKDGSDRYYSTIAYALYQMAPGGAVAWELNDVPLVNGTDGQGKVFILPDILSASAATTTFLGARYVIASNVSLDISLYICDSAGVVTASNPLKSIKNVTMAANYNSTTETGGGVGFVYANGATNLNGKYYAISFVQTNQTEEAIIYLGLSADSSKTGPNVWYSNVGSANPIQIASYTTVEDIHSAPGYYLFPSLFILPSGGTSGSVTGQTTFTWTTTVYDITGGTSTGIATGFYAMADEIGIDRSAFGILLTLICFFALWFISSAWSKEMPQNLFFVILLFAGSASMWAFIGVLPISVWVGFMAIVALLLFSKLREV